MLKAKSLNVLLRLFFLNCNFGGRSRSQGRSPVKASKEMKGLDWGIALSVMCLQDDAS